MSRLRRYSNDGIYGDISKPRLFHRELYVKNRGNYCPPDIDMFTPGSMQEDYCPLCGDPHNEYREHTFRLEEQSYTTAICYDCVPEVQLAHTVEESSDEYSLLAITRINNFINHAEYPDDIQDFFNKPNECAFCFKHIKPGMAERMQMPVGFDKTNYREFSVCINCTYHISKDFPKSLMFFDNCLDCKQVYSITEEEYRARKKNNTLETHVCGPCGVPRGLSEGIERFKVGSCSRCRRNVVADKSIPYEFNRFMADFSNGTLTCIGCSTYGSHETHEVEDSSKTRREQTLEKIKEIYKTTHLYQVKKDIYVVIFKRDVLHYMKNTYTFSIIEMVDNDIGWKELYGSKTQWMLIEDATTIAVGGAMDILNKIQKELDL